MLSVSLRCDFVLLKYRRMKRIEFYDDSLFLFLSYARTSHVSHSRSNNFMLDGGYSLSDLNITAVSILIQNLI